MRRETLEGEMLDKHFAFVLILCNLVEMVAYYYLLEMVVL